MTEAILELPRRVAESMLSDQAYRIPDQSYSQHIPVPPITMEASEPTRVRFAFFDIDPEPAGWFAPLLTKFNELVRLPSDWDSYGAKPIDPDTAALALSILLSVMSANDQHPAVVPTSGGGILLEWHQGGVDLEVDVRSPTSIHVYFDDGEIEEEFEHAEFETVREKMDLLRNRLQLATGNG